MSGGGGGGHVFRFGGPCLQIRNFNLLYTCVYIYKKLRYRSQFWSDFHDIHMVGAGPLIGDRWTLLFLETIGPIQPHIWGKMCPQNQFSGFKSDGMGFFWEKNLKTVFGTPFTKKKKGYIPFCRWTPRFLKNSDTHQNNFSLIFWKILFFSKKSLDKKYSKRRCL